MEFSMQCPCQSYQPFALWVATGGWYIDRHNDWTEHCSIGGGGTGSKVNIKEAFWISLIINKNSNA